MCEQPKSELRPSIARVDSATSTDRLNPAMRSPSAAHVGGSGGGFDPSNLDPHSRWPEARELDSIRVEQYLRGTHFGANRGLIELQKFSPQFDRELIRWPERNDRSGGQTRLTPSARPTCQRPERRIPSANSSPRVACSASSLSNSAAIRVASCRRRTTRESSRTSRSARGLSPLVLAGIEAVEAGRMDGLLAGAMGVPRFETGQHTPTPSPPARHHLHLSQGRGKLSDALTGLMPTEAS